MIPASNVIIPAPNVMLVGATGTGKTFACGTFIATYDSKARKWIADPQEDRQVKEVFHVFTEQSMETLSEIRCSEGYHYSYVPPACPDWDEMEKSALDINRLSMKALSMREGINKQEYDQFIVLLKALHNFKCDRCGKEFGDVSSWDNNRALVLDGLSGISIMAMDLVVGSKPVKSVADWGIAMDRVSRIVMKLCADTNCWMVLIAHLEMERDEITGRVKAMPSTLGRKLSPVLPRFFSEVIEARKEGTKFSWSTETAEVETKTRNLELRSGLPPSFKPLIAAWSAKHHEEERQNELAL
jgi:hypothetical protein